MLVTFYPLAVAVALALVCEHSSCCTVKLFRFLSFAMCATRYFVRTTSSIALKSQEIIWTMPSKNQEINKVKNSVFLIYLFNILVVLLKKTFLLSKPHITTFDVTVLHPKIQQHHSVELQSSTFNKSRTNHLRANILCIKNEWALISFCLSESQLALSR